MNTVDNTEYSIIALHHAKHPCNFGKLDEYDAHQKIIGPCGDSMEFWIKISNGCLERVTFITDGCGSSLACGSMTTCLAEGKELVDVLDLKYTDVLTALGGLPREHWHCATLAINTLHAACNEFLYHQVKNNLSDQNFNDSFGCCNNSNCCNTSHQ